MLRALLALSTQQAGAPGLDARTKYGLTALHLAAAAGHLQCATFLRWHGADMAAKDSKGAEPADLAALCGVEHAPPSLLPSSQGCDNTTLASPHRPSPPLFLRA